MFSSCDHSPKDTSQIGTSQSQDSISSKKAITHHRTSKCASIMPASAMKKTGNL